MILANMEQEANESADIIEQILQDSAAPFHELKSHFQNIPLNFIATLARGSSDHAALFAKYTFEKYLGIFTSSVAPSLHTIYKVNINYTNSIVLGISQSGKSHDLVESMKYARQNGALTLGFINAQDSPLAKECEFNIPLLAGKEKAVAATKSFIASMTRIIQFVTFFNGSFTNLNEELIAVANRIKELQKVEEIYPFHIFDKEKSILILGRGFSFPIAMEAALKIKETCGVHAEAFSAAEVLHGPIELVQKGFSVILFLNNDETLQNMLGLVKALKDKQAKLYIFTTSDIQEQQSNMLADIAINNIGTTFYPILNNILFIYKFYKFTAAFSKYLGRNPDKPENLNKVTYTI